MRCKSLPTDWLLVHNRLYSMKKHLFGKDSVTGFVRGRELLFQNVIDYQRKRTQGSKWYLNLKISKKTQPP